MQVRIEKDDIVVSFEKDFSDVIEYLDSKKGIIKTTVPYLYNGVWTNLLYEIAYYELDLEHIYSTYELSMLVKTGKVFLLSSRPYICVHENKTTREEDKYAEENLTTLQDYNSYILSRNSKENNELVFDMLKEFNESISKKCDVKIKRLENK